MNRQAQAVVLLLLGGAALRAGFTDMYLRYVKEVLQPFVIAAGAVLVVAGLMTLWYEWRRSEGHGAAPGTDDRDAHGHREPRVGWLLVAPVLGLLLVAPPALGSYSATTGGTAGAPLSAEQVAQLPPLPEHLDPVPLTVYDYVARALWDEEGSLAGRQVALTGFLITGEEEQPYLARLILSCCAADARPIKVGLAGAAAPAGLPDDTWVEVVGTHDPGAGTGIDPINEAPVPYLQVESWREVPAPRQPYE